MSHEPPRKGASGQDPSAWSFDDPLEREGEVLDQILTALARAQFPDEAWDNLHRAAERDGRLSELAFAYEAMCTGARINAVPANVSAEVHHQAARFFEEALGDEVAARAYLERAIALGPTNEPAFARLDALLLKEKSFERAGEIYLEVLQHRPRAEQPLLLKRAAELFDHVEGQEERVVEIYQQLLRIDPSDDAARTTLEERYRSANRLRDLARLLEQTLTVEPKPAARTIRRAHATLLDLYANQLHEPERSIAHVESLLEEDPSHDEARRIAEKLLEIRGLASRAAAALARAHSTVGNPEDVTRFLQIELHHSRGPKRKDVLAKIAVLRQDRLHDNVGAFEALEQALLLDATDDDLRHRYVTLASQLGRQKDAVKILARALTSVKPGATKARVGIDIGLALIDLGEQRRAAGLFADALAVSEIDPADALTAARALSEIHGEGKNHTAQFEALRRLCELENDPVRLRDATEKLAHVAERIGEADHAITAYERLLDTDLRSTAVGALERLYEKRGRHKELADLLELRASEIADEPHARELLIRAATIRTNELRDPHAAMTCWKAIFERFGPSRETIAVYAPLLEAERAWSELADVLSAEVPLLTYPSERLALLHRIAQIRFQKARDIPKTIETLHHVLELDLRDKVARELLERFASAGEHRADAALALESVYREEGAHPRLLRMLSIRAAEATTPAERLVAIEEALELAAVVSIDPGKVLELATRGLTEAVAAQSSVETWVARIEACAENEKDEHRHAELLAGPLEALNAYVPELLPFAERVSDALAMVGNYPKAIAILRKAIAHAPLSSDLLTKMDTLLRDRGSPEERRSVFLAALENASIPSRRKELLVRLARVESTELDDRTAAIRSYEEILTIDPNDPVVFDELLALYEKTGEAAKSCELLERRISAADPLDARPLRARLVRALLHANQEETAKQEARALLHGELSEDELGAAETVATVTEDAALLIDVLRKRVETTSDGLAQVALLERLADVQNESDHLTDAIATWKHAAQLAEQVGDRARAQALYSRARSFAPDDAEATGKLAEYAEQAGDFRSLAPLLVALADQAADDEARVDCLLRAASVYGEKLYDPSSAMLHATAAFRKSPAQRTVLDAVERWAIESHQLGPLSDIIDELLQGALANAAEDVRAAVLLVRARSLAGHSGGIEQAQAACRSIIELRGADHETKTRALRLFEQITASDPKEPRRKEAMRWLYNWRLEAADESTKNTALLAWAEAEESHVGDRARARELYRDVLARDPENIAAHVGLARVALKLGSLDEAIALLSSHRDRLDGPARSAFELELAEMLFAQRSRLEHAIESLEHVLEANPQDAAAIDLAARMLADSDLRLRAAALIEKSCDAIDDPIARARLLERLLRTEGVSTADAKLRWHERVVDLYAENEDWGAALEAALGAASAMPDVERFWDRAEAFVKQTKTPHAVADLYERTVQAAQAIPEWMPARAVAFVEEWFDEPSRAVLLLQAFFEKAPADEWLLQRLRLAYNADERWDELFQMFDRAIAAVSGERKRDLLRDAAQTAKDFAGRSDRAISYFESLVEGEWDDAHVVTSLERLYEKEKRFADLVTLLERTIERTPAAASLPLRTRMAGVLLDQLGDVENAYSTLKQALDITGLESDYAITAAPLLDRIAGRPPAKLWKGTSVPPSAASPDLRLASAELLAKIYDRPGYARQLARALLVQIENAKNIGERIEKHRRIARLFASVGDDQLAFDQCVQLAHLEPTSIDNREQFRTLAARLGELRQFAEEAVGVANEATSSHLKSDWLLAAATTYLEALNDSDSGIPLLLSIVRLENALPEAALDACRRLLVLLDRPENAGERLEVLAHAAKLEPELNTKKDRLGELAGLAVFSDNEPRAITAYEDWLVLDPTDREPLDKLIPLLERGERFERLAEALDTRSRSETRPESGAHRRADLVRRANVLSKKLSKPFEAISIYRQVELEFGESPESRHALIELLQLTGSWKDLAVVLAQTAASETDSGARADLLAQLGHLQLEHLDAVDAAVTSFDAALSSSPTNETARTGLNSLLEDELHRRVAVLVLLRAYQEAGEWPRVVELLPHRLKTAEDADAQSAILLETAEVSETKIHDKSLAFEAVRRAVVLSPADAKGWTEAERLARELNAFAELCESYDQAVRAASGASETAPLAVRLQIRAAEIVEQELHNFVGARERYEEVALAAFERSAARESLRLAIRLKDWAIVDRVLIPFVNSEQEIEPSLVRAITESVESADDWKGICDALCTALAAGRAQAEETAKELWAQLGTWERDRRADMDAAEKAFAKALDLDRENVELLTAIAELQRRNKGRELVDSLLRLSDATAGDLELLREATDVALGSLRDNGLAKSILYKAVRFIAESWAGGRTEPSVAPPVDYAGYADWAVNSVTEVLETRAEYGEAVDLLSSAATLPVTRATSRRWKHRAARTSLEKLADSARALTIYTDLANEDPTDDSACDALIQILIVAGRLIDVVRVREKQIQAARGLDRRLFLRMDSARRLVELNDVDRAIEKLQQNLEERPDDAATVTELAQVLHASAKFKELFQLWSSQARLAEDNWAPERAASAWFEAAQIAEEKLGDVEEALACHERVIAIEPRAESLDALARMATTRGDYRTAAHHLNTWLEVAEPKERTPVALRLAEAFFSAKDPVAAEEALERSLERDPSADGLRLRLIASYEGRQKWRALADTLRTGASHAPDKAARMQRLLHAADLFRQRCEAPLEAIPLMQQAVDLEPENMSVRLDLAETLAAGGSVAQARTILDEAIAAFGGRRPKERAPAHYKLAKLELLTGDSAKAIVELDTACRIDPTNVPIVKAFAELLRDDRQFDRAERAYRGLLALLRPKPGEQEIVTRSEILFELHWIAKTQGDRERAQEILRSAIESATQNPNETLRAEEILTAKEDDETLAVLHRDVLNRATDRNEIAQTSLRLANVLERSGHADEAVSILLSAVEHAPELEDIQQHAEEAARRSGVLEQYLVTLEKVAAAHQKENAELAVTVWRRAATMRETEFGDDDGAAQLYEKALARDPKNILALLSLAAIHRRQHRSDAERRTLERLSAVDMEATQSNALSEARYRLAELKLAEPEEISAGCDLLELLLEVVPDYERATAAIAKAAEIAPSNDRVLNLFETVARTSGDQQALLQALTLRSRRDGEDGEALREAVQLSHQIGDSAHAEDLLRRFIDLEKSTTNHAGNLSWAMAALANIREQSGNISEAITLKKAAVRLADGEAMEQLAMDAGSLAERANDFEAAAEIYESLWSRDRANRGFWEALLRVYGKQNAYEKMADLLDGVVDYIEDLRECARARLDAVQIRIEHLGLKPSDAVPLLLAIIDDDPSLVDAALLAASILEKQNNTSQLIGLLTQQLEEARDRQDAASVASFALRLAPLLVTEDPMSARNVYYTALEWDDKSPELLRGLANVLYTHGDRAEWADVAERLLVADDSVNLVPLGERLIAHRREQGDAEGLRVALEHLHRRTPLNAAVRDELEQLYVAAEDWGKLANLWLVDADNTPDIGARGTLLRRAGRYFAGKAGDVESAAKALRQARTLDPQDFSIVQELTSVLIEGGDTAGALEELSNALDSLPREHAHRARLLGHRAEIRASIGEPAKALEDLDAAFSIAPETFAGVFVEHIEEAIARASAAADPDEARRLRLRLVEVLPAIGDAEKARKLLNEILRTDPRDLVALRALAKLEQDEQRFDLAVPVYRRLIALEEGEELVRTALLLSTACERAGRLSDARGGLERARMVAPNDPRLREQLEYVYRETGHHRELAELVLADAKATGDAAGRFALLLRAGEILLEFAKDPQGALAALNEAHAIRPNDLPLIALLADAYIAQHDNAKAKALLNVAVQQQRGRRSRELAQIYCRLAVIFHNQRDQGQELAHWTRALELDPQDAAIAGQLAQAAIAHHQFELANRALRTITMLKAVSLRQRATAFKQLGEVAQLQGDPKRAAMFFKRALAEDAELVDAKELLDQLGQTAS